MKKCHEETVLLHLRVINELCSQYFFYFFFLRKLERKIFKSTTIYRLVTSSDDISH